MSNILPKRFPCPVSSNAGFRSLLLAAAWLVAWWAVAAEPGPATFEVRQTETAVTVASGGQTILEYCRVPSPKKPYVQQLTTPRGVPILRDSPHDHKHHHALMFAIAAGGTGFWEESPKGGFQLPQGPVTVTQGPNGASVTLAQSLQWSPPDDGQPGRVAAADRIVLEERRTITLHTVPGARLLTWRSRLTVPKREPARPITLTGSHYYGLGLRFVESMDRVGRFLHSEGKDTVVVRGTEQVTPGRWCAYQATAQGAPVTVALFDAPKNPRSARFFTMTQPFSYLSATFNVWKEPMTLTSDAPLEFRWGVALWDGQVDAGPIDTLARQWGERLAE